MSKSPMTVKLVTQYLVGAHEVKCNLCGDVLDPGDVIQWDHVHAEVFGGPHTWSNLRPIHSVCHKSKTKADVQANAKVKRIIKGGRRRKGAAMKSKPFPAKSRPFPKRKK